MFAHIPSRLRRSLVRVARRVSRLSRGCAYYDETSLEACGRRIGRMDFDSFARGGIDFSPYQPTPVIRMVLCESELRGIQEHRFERFFRVWCTERATYAPCLRELVILLRPSFERAEPLRVQMEGIHSFLDYFDRHVSREVRSMTLKIYVDSWCESRDARIHYANAPQSVFESSPETEPIRSF